MTSLVPPPVVPGMSYDRCVLDRGFSEALRAAIEASGLGLDRLRARLRTRGIVVSTATLSYWQSGRSRPERPDSLRALACLEEELGLPARSLSSLLGPPRPRGRYPGKAVDTGNIAAWWPSPGDVADAVSGVDIRWDAQLTRLSQHDVVTIGADRDEQSFISRQVLRAEASGPDRWVVILHLDEHDRPLPDIKPLRNCRLGRVVQNLGTGLLVAELLFDRPLTLGQTLVIEHALINRPPYPLATNYERKFRRPVRMYVLEVCFQPEALPTGCERFIRVDGQPERVHDTPLDESHSAHGVALNFGPGCYGFRWHWP